MHRVNPPIFSSRSHKKKRLFKETTLYRVEAEKLEEKKSKLLAAGEDPGEWDFKNAVSGPSKVVR